MNDRFKFRAWNKLSNEMKDVISLNINYDFPDCSNVVLETNTFDAIKTHNNPINCSVGLKNVVIMQCTGLKDKNGKLIFEGDILKDKYGALHPISWNKKGFFEADTFAVAGFYNAIQEDMEIIGNIYENPDLLQECE